MTMHEFKFFAPANWFIDGLEVIPQQRKQKSEPPKRRDAPWRVAFAASVLTIGVAFSAELIVVDPRASSVAFGEIVSAAKTPAPAGMQDDRSFASLFASFSAGHSLLSSEHMRQLARAAVEAKPGEDVNAWAERLANDTSKAND